MDVKLPDGTVVRNVPDGTTQEDLMSRLQAFQANKGGDRQQRLDALYQGNAPAERNFTSSALHGAIDTAGGVAQLVSRGATALGLPPGTDNPFVASPDVVDRDMERARGQVDRRFGPPNAGGIDLVRGGASTLLATPAMGAVGTAPSMLGRSAQAARAGAVGGAVQPVNNAEDGRDFVEKKLFQAGTGAAVGAVMQPGLEVGASWVQSLANRVLSRANGALKDGSEQAAAAVAREMLGKQGIAFEKLERGVQQSILSDVQEALKKYGGVNSAALARQSDFKALDIDPLEPWVTRDPVKWGQYKNLETAKDAGEPLITAKNKTTEKLYQRIEELRGTPMGDHYTAGSVAGKALSSKHKADSANVTRLYDSFRATAPNVAADPKRLTDTILDGVEKDALGDYLGSLKNLVNDFATGKRPTTPDSLYRAQQVANAEVRKGGNEGRAARKVVEAIDNELEQMGRDMSAVGPEMKQAAEILKQARAAHRSLKTSEEAIPALKAVAEGTFAAEDFFNAYIKGGDVKEVAAMWTQIKSPEMKQAARSQLIDYLKKAAEGQEFLHKPFKNVLDEPGMNQKIKIIIGESGLEQLRRVQRAAEYSGKTPPGSRYNTSGTAMEMMNLLRRSTGVPGIGPLVTGPLHTAGQQFQTQGLLNPGSSAIGQGILDPFYEEILRRSRQGAGLLSAGGGTSASGEFSR